MPLHRIRLYLRVTLVCIALAIVEVFAWGLLTAKPGIVRPRESAEKQHTTNRSDQRDLPAIADFATLGSRRLRQSLNSDSQKSPAMTAPVPQQTTLSTIRLVGTIMDGRRAIAVLSDRSGNQELKAIGEHVGRDAGSAIVEITAEQVVLEQRGVRTTLALERPPSMERFSDGQSGETPTGKTTL